MIVAESSVQLVQPADEMANTRWVLLGLLATAVLLFIRNPYVVLVPQFWHEDALIFLHDQRTLGPAAIFKPYAGYLHLYPRLVAAIAGCLPLLITPLIFLTTAYIGWLGTSALVLTSPIFANVRWALLAVLAGIVVPHSGEVMVNLTNVQWIFAPGLALLLAEPLGHRRSSPLGLVYATFASLSGPVSTVLIPVAFWRLIQGMRKRVFDPTSLIVFAGGIIQFAFILAEATRLKTGGTIDWGFFSLVLSIGVFPEFLGTQSTFPADLPWRLTGTAAGVTGILWCLQSGRPLAANRRLLLSGGTLLLLASLASCLSGFGYAPSSFGAGARYLYPPFVLFSWCLVSAVSVNPPSSRARLIGVTLLATSTLYSLTHFVAPKYSYPDWSEVCRLLEAGHSLKVQVAPLGNAFTITPFSLSEAPPAPPK